MPVHPPDFEKYAQTLQKTMAQAIAEAESLTALATADREAAADLRVAKQARLNELESQGDRAAVAYVTEHRQPLWEKQRQEVLLLLVKKLLRSGRTPVDVANLLGVSEAFVHQAQQV